MLSGLHLKKPTQETRGASYQHILEHILQYPGSYDIPLRTMYAINATPFQHIPNTLQQNNGAAPSSSTAAAMASSLHQHGQGPVPTRELTARFTSSLIDQISNLPSQPCSLPTVYMTSFLRRCFTVELELVDFPQSLTGLDYLKDLETRRRREVEAAMQRLGTHRGIIGTASDAVSERYPAVAMWGIGIKGSEKRAEALYTQLFASLRRWILINEYSLEPFNRTNCITMLNTLYPHVSSSQPMPGLTPETLRKQRDIFFQYIAAVEKRGRGVLTVLMLQGKAEGDQTGWPATHATLDKYLRITKSLIDECSQISGVDYFDSGGATREHDLSGSKHKEKRKNENGRHRSLGRLETTPFPNTADPQGSNSGSGSNSNNTMRSPTSMSSAMDDGKGLSTLEKLAKELRRIKGRTRPDLNNSDDSSTRSPVHSEGGGHAHGQVYGHSDAGAAFHSSGGKHFFKRLRSGASSIDYSSRGGGPRSRSESAMSFRTADTTATMTSSIRHPQCSRLSSLDSPAHRTRFLSAAANTDTIRLR